MSYKARPMPQFKSSVQTYHLYWDYSPSGSYQDYSLVSFIQIQLYNSFLLTESLLMRPSDKP